MTRTRTAFATILLSLIAVMSGPFWLPAFESREDVYDAVPTRFANFHYIKEQIFESDTPLGVVLLGSSSMWTAFDPMVLEASLSELRGTQTPVRVFAHNWRAEETIYYMLKDLHDQGLLPELAIASYPEGAGFEPHPVAGYLFSPWLHGDVIKTLPLREAFSIYMTSVATVPRRIVNLIIPFPEVLKGRNAGVRKSHGAVLSARGFLEKGKKREEYRTEWFDSSPYELNASWMKRHRDIAESPTLSPKHVPVKPIERSFINATAALMQSHRFAYTFLPSAVDELTEIIYRPDMPALDCVPYMGVPLASLFPTADRQTVRDAYYNTNHNNAAGAAYRSRIHANIIAQLLNDDLPPCNAKESTDEAT